LVQTTFAVHGVPLPRDAWQQEELGQETARSLDALRAGDLLFFSDRPDGRITHVGVGLGPERMVHLGLGRGGYAVERLDDSSDSYVVKLRARLRSVRRVV